VERQDYLFQTITTSSVPASSSFTDPRLHPPVFRQGGAGGKNIPSFFSETIDFGIVCKGALRLGELTTYCFQV